MKHLILIFSLILVAPTFAEAGPGSGNGGNLVRIDIISVINQVSRNCDKWNSIRYTQAGDRKVCDLVRDKIENVGFGKERLRLLPQLKDDRTGENFPEIPEVHFSESKWTANKDNTIAKIGIVLHEYLGLIGLEKTDEYQLSKAVMNELQAVSLVSSDNPNFMATMTKVQALITKAKSCDDSSSPEDRVALTDAALGRLRKLGASASLGTQEKKALKKKIASIYELRKELGLALAESARGEMLNGKPQKAVYPFCPQKKTERARQADWQAEDSEPESGSAN